MIPLQEEFEDPKDFEKAAEEYKASTRTLLSKGINKSVLNWMQEKFLMVSLV